MKRFVSLFLVMLIVLFSVFVLSACSDDESKKDKNDSKDKNEDTTQVTTNTSDSEEHVFDEAAECELGTPSKTVDPETVYNSIEYDERMFYGQYRIEGGESAKDDFAKNTALIDYKKDYSEKITAFPYYFQAGKNTMAHTVVGSIRGKHIMECYFLSEQGNLLMEYCTFEVDGDKLVINLIKEYEYSDENKTLKYVMSDLFLEYEYDFNGTELVLSNENGRVSLYSDVNFEYEYGVSVDNYLSPGSDMIDDLEYLWIYWSDSNNKGTFSAGKDFGKCNQGVATMNRDGLMTFSYPNEDEVVKTHQFAYFLCGEDGIILSDGTNTYYYCVGYAERSGANISDNILAEDVDKLSEDDVDKIVEKKANLLDDLAKAYEDAGVKVVIDRESGEIELDSTVLFEYNKYDVSKEGKEFLNKFMKIYTDTVFDEKYADFISLIMIEGHTDPKGNRDDNFELSEKRAEAVKAYCLSKECGVKEEYKEVLQDSLGAAGYADLDPVYTADGKIDDAASRRVAFRFVVDISWLA